jgi:hypothetical protein
LFAVLVGDAPLFGQEAAAPVDRGDSSAPVGMRYNVADEWEMHRRAASPEYRPKYRPIFVDPGYSRYCPIRPYWNGVFTAGGSPRADACCPLFSK